MPDALQVLSIIDLDTSQPFVSTVHAMQYDTVRTVEAHLYFSGVKWYVPSSNIYKMVSYRKTDRIGGFYDLTEQGVTAVTVDENDRSVIYISIDRNVVTTPGEVQVETVFMNTITGSRLSSFSFIVDVEEVSVTETNLANNPNFYILAEKIDSVLNIDKALSDITATASKLAPNATPSVNVIGGPDGTSYNFAFAIPSMPGLTATATRLAPNAVPTAYVTGGNYAGQNFNINLGIPSMPAMTATVKSLPEGTPPTVSVTGGSAAGQAYNVQFGIPYASSPTVNQILYAYAVSESGTTPPESGWQSTITALGGQDALKGKFLWSRAIANWSSGGQSINYAAAYNGMDATGAVVSINGRDGVVNLRMSDIFTLVGQI